CRIECAWKIARDKRFYTDLCDALGNDSRLLPALVRQHRILTTIDTVKITVALSVPNEIDVLFHRLPDYRIFATLEPNGNQDRPGRGDAPAPGARGPDRHRSRAHEAIP